jgi:transcriptional regulator with XRE-family HTH domain
MRLHEIGQAIRHARLGRNLTQAQLAAKVGISRETLNLLESGLVRDLGLRKVLAVLDELGLVFNVEAVGRARKPNYVRMACTSANVSLKNALTEDELAHALITGKVPRGRDAHLRTIFDEAPEPLLRGLVAEARRWTNPGKLQRNIHKLAGAVRASREVDPWLTTD